MIDLGAAVQLSHSIAARSRRRLDRRTERPIPPAPARIASLNTVRFPWHCIVCAA